MCKNTGFLRKGQGYKNVSRGPSCPALTASNRKQMLFRAYLHLQIIVCDFSKIPSEPLDAVCLYSLLKRKFTASFVERKKGGGLCFLSALTSYFLLVQWLPLILGLAKNSTCCICLTHHFHDFVWLDYIAPHLSSPIATPPALSVLSFRAIAALSK